MPTWMSAVLFFGAIFGGVVAWEKVKERGGRTQSALEGVEAVGSWFGSAMELLIDLFFVVLGLVALFLVATHEFSWKILLAGLFMLAVPVLRRAF